MKDPERLIGPYCVLLMLALLILVLVFAPTQLDELSVGWKLLLLVAATGALGATIHASTSFGELVGLKEFEPEWQWWYLLRPLIGAAIALIFVAAIKGLWTGDGSELPTDSAGKVSYVLGCLAFAGLAGMFSRQATNWLGQLFQNVLQLGGERNKGSGGPKGPSTGGANIERALDQPTETGKTWRTFALAAIGLIIALVISIVILLPMSHETARFTAAEASERFGSEIAADGGSLVLIDSHSEPTLLVLAILLAALGGTVHIVTSFALFAGKRALESQWIWWYVTRPFISASLGLLIYIAVRAVWLEALIKPYEIYVLLGVSFLSGMFSKQTIEWLKGIYDAIFREFSNVEKSKEDSGS